MEEEIKEIIFKYQDAFKDEKKRRKEIVKYNNRYINMTVIFLLEKQNIIK